ncbi:hypothetical protein [Catellatospora vulcania]|uniref:hypothetical protein n=1 Tax=Catellatospora vulcania TaxID=1460450 RepID=UPI0012D46D66|nr:hypothetical protein [Catellatospora vulcania]
MDLAEALQIRPGDVLRLTADPVETEIVRLDRYYVYLRTPWGQVDPASAYRWDGSRAFPRHDDNHDWLNTPWRYVEEPGKVGSSCSLHIPPTTVVVRESVTHDPPLDTGELPRPVLMISVCPKHLLDHEEAGYGVWFDTSEPIDVELISSGS